MTHEGAWLDMQDAIDGPGEWQDFPPDNSYTYVVCQSGEGEHRFWSNEHGWTDLDSCDHFSIDDVHTHGNTPVHDGFWVDYQRAQELVEQ